MAAKQGHFLRASVVTAVSEAPGRLHLEEEERVETDRDSSGTYISGGEVHVRISAKPIADHPRCKHYKCILPIRDTAESADGYLGTLPPIDAYWLAKEFDDNNLPTVRAPYGWAEQIGLDLAVAAEFTRDKSFLDAAMRWSLNVSTVESYLVRLHHAIPERAFLCQRVLRGQIIAVSGLDSCVDSTSPAACVLHALSHYSYAHSPMHGSVLLHFKAAVNGDDIQIFSCEKAFNEHKAFFKRHRCNAVCNALDLYALGAM